MANAPLSEQFDGPYEEGSENKGYIFHELKSWAKTVEQKNYVTPDDLVGFISDLLRIVEEKQPQDESNQSFQSLSERVSVIEELGIKEALALLTDALEAANYEDLKKAVDLAAGQIDAFNQTGLLASMNNIASKVEDVEVYKLTRKITSAELLALNATPLVLLAAPPEGQYIELQRVETFLDYNTTAYTLGANNDLSIQYETAGEIMQIECTGLLDQTADKRRYQHHEQASDVPYNLTTQKSEGLNIQMLDSEVTLGDSPLTVRLEYRIIDLLL